MPSRWSNFERSTSLPKYCSARLGTSGLDGGQNPRDGPGAKRALARQRLFVKCCGMGHTVADDNRVGRRLRTFSPRAEAVSRLVQLGAATSNDHRAGSANVTTGRDKGQATVSRRRLHRPTQLRSPAN
jgi:hypothetical protein